MNSSTNSTQDRNTCISETTIYISYLAIGGVAIIGNAFIIILALKFTKRKSLHHLIINMAFSDILVVATFIHRVVGNTLPNNMNNAFIANTICKILFHTIQMPLTTPVVNKRFLLLILGYQVVLGIH